MSKSNELSQKKEKQKNEALDFKYQEKASGLSGETKFKSEYDSFGIEIQYHKHPETGELIIIEQRAIPNGPDDIDWEWEVVAVHEPIICELSMSIEELRKKLLKL